MKTRTQHVGLAVVVALLVGCSKAPPPASPDPGPADASSPTATSLASIIASCASTSGEVQVRRAGKPYWEAVTTGAVFRAGDWVRTSKGAAARVEFLVGGGLTLGAEAVVVIDAAPPAAGAPETTAPEALVEVESGEVRGFAPDAQKEGPTPALHIKTADGSDVALVAKEGSEPMEFRLTRGSKATEVAVLRGTGTLRGAAGEIELRRGQAADVAGGKASEVVELPDFPQLSEPGIDARFEAKAGQVIRLGWKAVPLAASYRLEIARDFSFQVQTVVADTEETSYDFRPEREAVFVWHVASRDGDGRQGEFGFARRIYFEHEQPKDLLLGPEDGAIFSSLDPKPKVTFSWQSAADARAYRLLISTSEDLLRGPVVNLRAQDQRAEVKTLGPGEYWWGAYIEGDPPTPIFLKARKLTIKKATKGKLKTPKAINQWGE
jgi:hypothetical protein